jgi:hypothetical protein
MEPDDDRTGTGTDSDHEPVVGGIHRPGCFRSALVALALIAVLALIVVGAVRLWQA